MYESLHVIHYLVAQLVKNQPAIQEAPVQFLGQERSLERDRLPTPVFLGFPGDSDSKESACKAGDLGLIPGSGKAPGGGHGNPFQYSCLKISMDRGTGGLHSMGSQRIRHNSLTHTCTLSLHWWSSG